MAVGTRGALIFRRERGIISLVRIGSSVSRPLFEFMPGGVARDTNCKRSVGSDDN
jgi:hypothetical protein